MSLTPTSAWLAHCTGADWKPVHYVDLYDGTTHWYSLSRSVDASSDLYGTQEGVLSVKPVGVTLDPLTRKLETAEYYVDFQDEYLRPLVVNHRLKGKQMTVKLGAAGLSTADFLQEFVGTIESVTPVEPGTVRVSGLTPLEILRKTKIVGVWINKHPLEALYLGDGSGILEKGGVVSFNAASFSPAAYTDISHLVVGRGGGAGWQVENSNTYVGGSVAGLYAVREPTPAWDLAQEILGILNAHLVVDENGECRFVRFDSTAAIVDTWTLDDVVPESFQQEEIDANMVNRIVCRFGLNAEGNFSQTYQADDTASQSAYAYPGGTSRIVEHTIECRWLNGISCLMEDVAAGAVSLISWCNNESFVGNRSDAWAAPAAGRPAYLMLDSYASADGNPHEIVKATALARDIDAYLQIYNPDTQITSVQGPWKAKLTYSNLTQFPGGGAGTANHFHRPGSGTPVAKVYDCTPLVLLADELLARFAYGCPLVKVDTLIHKVHRQVGDLLAYVEPRFMAYGIDGLTGSHKMEIVGKEVDVYADPPCVHWTLAYAGINALTRTARGGFKGGYGITDEALIELAQRSMHQPYVYAGLTVTAIGGFVGRVAAGTVKGSTIKWTFGQKDITFPASKDTYLTVDMASGELALQPVNNGAAVPPIIETHCFVAKVITDGAGITSVSYTYGSYSKQTVPLTSITALASRSLDDVQDSTVGGYIRVQSVSVGHQCQAGSLATNCVETAKINPEAVTGPKVADSAVGYRQTTFKGLPGSGAVFNNNLQVYSRG